ncbi:protein MTO1 homolog, mitochondrial-like [Littorina saxatilis]
MAAPMLLQGQAMNSLIKTAASPTRLHHGLVSLRRYLHLYQRRQSRANSSSFSPSSSSPSSSSLSSSLSSSSLSTSSSPGRYDVIVVGGGHAGTEAACAAARMGANTLLLTHKVDTIGAMSCNPSFGGIGKGHLMKEIDALDGVCARVCDKSGVQYKVLNRRKGPAVWGPRAQIDRDLYKEHIQKEVFNSPGLTIMAAPVEDLLLGEATLPDHGVCKQKCKGVVLGDGNKIYSDTVVLTAGTFLRGSINIGLTSRPAGRLGDEPAIGLAKTIENAGFKMGRLKTGTPPRLDGRTIDYSKLLEKPGDNPPMPFSFLSDSVWIKPEDQLLCHMTHTSPGVDAVVMETLDQNRHVQEEVCGPRYCPSIESKIMRFKGRRHQVWLEPEGLNTDVVYPNGISCTMPEEHQVRLVRAIPGLETCDLVHPGYGVEYDFMDPRQLKPSLETLLIQHLFFAGQINGTTGYEEAAAQGIIAGINAACKSQGKEPLIMDRTQGYIGVLIDDLTTQGTNEPYRMFTSRAEFRLALRPDNADVRLTQLGFQTGCVSKVRFDKSQWMKKELEENVELLRTFQQPIYKWRRQLGLNDSNNTNTMSAIDLLIHPDVTLSNMVDTYPDVLGHLKQHPALLERVEIEAKYHTELQQQLEEIEEVRQEEQLQLPDDLDYYSLNMSTDAKLKLADARPASIAAASRIPGITPAAIVILLRHVKYRQRPLVTASSKVWAAHTSHDL